MTGFANILADRKFYDISRRISNDALVYPDDAPIAMKAIREIGPTCPCNVMSLDGMSTHTLTHVDTPFHFIADGKSLDELPLSRFCGKAIVVRVDSDVIQPEHIPSEQDVLGVNILFRTRNSDTYDEKKFDNNHVYISKVAAALLAKRKANMVGIDYLSVDQVGDEAYPAHYALLGNNVLILENIDLKNVKPGTYYLNAFPLKIAQGDGSPVRAMLME